jgi:ligand-binding sensor domain-containing protein
LKSWVSALALAALLVASAPPGYAAGAWTTYMRPGGYGRLVATSDTVWCSAVDAGLVYYVRSAGSFGSYTRQPGGLASNNLSALAQDRSGDLWIGTADAGVSRLSPDGTWGVLNAFDGLPGLAVNTIRAEGDSLWIGTTQGLALYDGTEISGRLPDGAAPSPFASNDITGIVLTGDSVWVSTSGGSAYYALRSAQLSTWTRVSAGMPPSGLIDGLATDGANLWALGYDQLWLLQGSAWSQVNAGWGNVYRVSDEFGRVLTSTTSGVYEYQGGSWVQVPGSPVSGGSVANSMITTTDPSGTIFAGSAAGIFQQPAAPGGAWPLQVPPGPPGNNVQNLLVDGSRLYVATFDEGFARFDGQTWTLWGPVPCSSNCGSTLYDPIYPFALLRDRHGQKWLGCWSAVVDRLDDSGPVDTVTHVLIPQSPSDAQHTWLWSAAADSMGGIWFGGDTPALGSTQPQDQPIGIDYYDSTGVHRMNYQPGNGDTLSTMANVQVRSLAFDTHGNTMWVGFAGHGVQSFTVPTNPDGTPIIGAKLQFRTLLDAVRLDVFAVIPYGESLWVFNTNDLRLYTGFGGSNSSVAYSIPAGPAPRGALHPLDVASDGTVWLGTTNGVRVYHPGGATEDFNITNSPIANDEVRTVRIDPRTGAVWIATATGLNRYDPNYRPPPAPPLPYLQARVYPNPVAIANLIGTSLHITGNAPTYGGRVFGVDGRLVRRLTATPDGQLLWDGRDESGVLVRPGLYFVRVEAGGRQMTARVTLLR